jgi:hypothetical protein
MKYELGFPDYQDETDFNFNTTVKGESFSFRFRWYELRWNAWATLPSGEIRAFGIFPGVESWTGFVDYGITIETSASVITFVGLADCAIVLEVKE